MKESERERERQRVYLCQQLTTATKSGFPRWSRPTFSFSKGSSSSSLSLSLSPSFRLSFPSFLPSPPVCERTNDRKTDRPTDRTERERERGKSPSRFRKDCDGGRPRHAMLVWSQSQVPTHSLTDWYFHVNWRIPSKDHASSRGRGQPDAEERLRQTKGGRALEGLLRGRQKQGRVSLRWRIHRCVSQSRNRHFTGRGKYGSVMP